MTTNLKQLEEAIKPKIDDFKMFELITSDVCKAGSLYGPCSTCMFKEYYILKANYSSVPLSPIPVTSLYCLHTGLKFEKLREDIEYKDALRNKRSLTKKECSDICLKGTINSLFLQGEIKKAINNYKLFKSKSHV